jgi:hypothetical protein
VIVAEQLSMAVSRAPEMLALIILGASEKSLNGCPGISFSAQKVLNLPFEST